ncbi:acetoacetate--CoA ligase [Hydrogenophaga sp. 5NK40-0174]|uniref:acetoacetate--CoA ligase n=1 Tax=Hydrogenophaga sp. 5NK40-0174 TaxID=3127649 RepID=UPI00310B4EEF
MSEQGTPNFVPQIRLYQNWLAEHRGLQFEDYASLWKWSTTDLDAFWQSIWDYFDLHSPSPHTAVLARNVMPGAQWFPGAQVNYAQQVLRHVEAADQAGMPALIGSNEKGQRTELSWPELQRQVAALALHLREQGVQPGDRVAAYLPNIAETAVAFLAVVSIGAVWSVCAPDMGTNAVLDRFKQIEPVALIACDGVTYGGKDHSRLDVVAQLRAALPTVRHVVLHTNLAQSGSERQAALGQSAPCADWSAIVARDDAAVRAFEPVWLPFDHPLWIVYSSGTTGMPKPIVHGHGGTIIVALALKTLHNDVGCSYHPNSWGERYHWYSSTGWVMWNAQLSGLLNGTTCVIYDGNPGGSKERPDWTTLWRFAADNAVTFFGAGAAFYANCLKAGVDLSTCGDLSTVRALGSTGSPLSEEAQNWGTEQFRRLRNKRAEAAHHAQQGSEGADDSTLGRPKANQPPGGAADHAQQGSVGADIWFCNISGGTDFAGAFIGGHRELPQTPGRMQCRLLGCAVESWNESGQPVIDEVGELVCAQPIPSMPLYFVGDVDNKRLLGSYFDMYPPGQGRKPGGGDLLLPPRSPAAHGALPPRGG